MPKNEIYVCFNCGAKNRVPAGRIATAKCGKCNELLLWEERDVPDEVQNSPPGPRSTSLEQTPSRRKKRLLNPLLLLVIIGGVAFPLFMEMANSPQVSRKPPKPIVRETLPPIVYQRPGVLWNNTGRMGSAPFEIITPPGFDYYIKLVDYNSDEDMIGIFVKGGQRLEVTVPPGSYKIRYATGKTWRGKKHLFGPGRYTSFFQSLSRFDFSLYDGYTVELIRQTGGNMPTRSISASQF